ncbi:hypothetical protein D9M71_650830 [compost metagenome]
MVFDRGEIVQAQIFIEESGNHRVIVTDGDITSAPMHHQACQRKARAHLEDALACKVHRQHGVREDLARWPDLSEQRPAFRGYAQALRFEFGIVILLVIEQRAYMKLHIADRYVLVFNLITKHA